MKTNLVHELLLSKPEKTTITIRASVDLLERLKAAAEAMDVKYTSLMWGLVQHGLERIEAEGAGQKRAAVKR